MTDIFRYGEINGVKVVLPTMGVNNNNTEDGYLIDYKNYTDLAKIWDIVSNGTKENGTPNGWAKDWDYWSAETVINKEGFHRIFNFDVLQMGDRIIYGGYTGLMSSDNAGLYVVLQVL